MVKLNIQMAPNIKVDGLKIERKVLDRRESRMVKNIQECSLMECEKGKDKSEPKQAITTEVAGKMA